VFDPAVMGVPAVVMRKRDAPDSDRAAEEAAPHIRSLLAY
jgi:hypothetical protein